MVRTLVTLLLAVTVSAVTAQNIQVTEAMKAKATERMELVDRTVGGLNATQKVEIEKVYLDMEQYRAALDQRYANAHPETREGDMAGQLEQMDRMVNEKLATILSKEQLATWTEASR